MSTAVQNNVISPVNIAERSSLDIRTGDTVKIQLKIQEKGKTRLQPYEGVVIARKHGNEAGATITVRRTASGIGMEKILPIYSPNISKIEILKRAKARRSKLYYIREKAAKAARKKLRQMFGFSKITVADESKVEESSVEEVESPEVEAPVEEAAKQEEEVKQEEKAEEAPEENKEEEKKEE